MSLSKKHIVFYLVLCLWWAMSDDSVALAFGYLGGGYMGGFDSSDNCIGRNCPHFVPVYYADYLFYVFKVATVLISLPVVTCYWFGQCSFFPRWTKVIFVVLSTLWVFCVLVLVYFLVEEFPKDGIEFIQYGDECTWIRQDLLYSCFL